MQNPNPQSSVSIVVEGLNVVMVSAFAGVTIKHKPKA
jgi:hypothetical protein